MARLPRLAVSGHPHYLLHRGHNRQPIVVDDDDRRAFLGLLREAAATHRVDIHAYTLLDNEIHVVATPREAQAASRMMQSLGRRYVAWFNRRHGRTGTLWEGRFRGTVLERDRHLLSCMCLVESAPVRTGLVADASEYPWSSARHHLAGARDALVTDPPQYWALGNTPFERELAYRRRLEQGLGAAEADAMSQAAEKGWALGSPAFIAKLREATGRPLQPRPRGRPRTASKSVPI